MIYSRTVQYGCKLIWYLLWKNKSNKDYIEVLKKIESAMSNTRKGLNTKLNLLQIDPEEFKKQFI
jgi:hypothetical protein